jgi:hypothetical protein
LSKFYPFRYRKPPRHQKDLTKIESPHSILSLKQQEQRTEKEIEGCKKKNQITYKVNPSKSQQISNRNLKSKKDIKRGISGTE